MSHFPDLSKYTYSGKLGRPKMVNVGWLDGAHRFKTARPPLWFVQRLWSYCQCSIIQLHGFHQCNLPDCPGPSKKMHLFHEDNLNKEEIEKEYAAECKALKDKFKDTPGLYQFLGCLEDVKNDRIRGYSRLIIGVHPKTKQRMNLGSAEIRVFGKRGKIYAAPNMLYHYVTAHQYKPPDEFLHALKESPCPPTDNVLIRLLLLRFPLSLANRIERRLQQKRRYG
jgi:hypothetical protein